jgi:hypothetical protein
MDSTIKEHNRIGETAMSDFETELAEGRPWRQTMDGSELSPLP